MLLTGRDMKQTSYECDLVSSALTALIQLMRLLLHDDEVKILRKNYKKKSTWSSNFEFPQKYITHQIAIYFNSRTRNFTGQKKKTWVDF